MSDYMKEAERLIAAHESAIRQHDRGAEWDEGPAKTLAALLAHIQRGAPAPAEVPMPQGYVERPSDYTGDIWIESQMRAYGAAREAAGYERGLAVAGRDADARGMFVARLGNMADEGLANLTVQDVLALLNDCDMLAERGGFEHAALSEEVKP